MKYNFLVTGCGGDIGQSIGKILSNSKYLNNLYGKDISDKNAGKFVFKNFFKGPNCSDPDYIKYLEKFVSKFKIDFIIPISESELRFLFKINNIEKIGSAKLITASYNSLLVGFDKLITSRFLEKNNFLFPITNEIKDSASSKFPLILKSKNGSGSKSVILIKNNIDYDFYCKKYPDFIVQEFLSDDFGEITCGLYRSSNKDIRLICFKRELYGGFSGYGEIIENYDIKKLLINFAIKINLTGSINVQLRLTSKGPIIFEINPRFSSTVLFRHMFGFKDLEWSIEDILGLKISEYNKPITGRKFFKGFNEYID